MNDLFTRTGKGEELTWEELDTNWMRIQNGVDELEVQLQDTRAQRDWVLPLYFYGDESSARYIRLGYRDIEGVPAGCIEEVHPDYNVVSYQFGNVGYSSNFFYFSAFFINDGQPGYFIGVEQTAPYSHILMSVEADEVAIRVLFDPVFQVRVVEGEVNVGFFGELATQQSIAETSSDAAISELQNILIAYGLAIDNRS